MKSVLFFWPYSFYNHSPLKTKLNLLPSELSSTGNTSQHIFLDKETKEQRGSVSVLRTKSDRNVEHAAWIIHNSTH